MLIAIARLQQIMHVFAEPKLLRIPETNPGSNPYTYVVHFALPLLSRLVTSSIRDSQQRVSNMPLLKLSNVHSLLGARSALLPASLRNRCPNLLLHWAAEGGYTVGSTSCLCTASSDPVC